MNITIGPGTRLNQKIACQPKSSDSRPDTVSDSIGVSVVTSA